MTNTSNDNHAENALSQTNMKTEHPAPVRSPPPTYRLGILSLGWHAHERSMPASLMARLQAGDAMVLSNMVPLLGRLSLQDPSIGSTYLCDPSVQYITKLPREGSFCGYRNIQMLISFILARGSGFKPGVEGTVLSTGIPSIPSLQSLIEAAWDLGFNPSARIETGGIIGTRKHIGTPEAQALFQSLGIKCLVRRFESRAGVKAWDLLLEFVEEHFTTEIVEANPAGKEESNLKKQTTRPPIYLQRPRHSLTVIGMEVHKKTRKRSLLVFDPGERPSPRMMRAAEAEGEGGRFEKRVSLRAYRKGMWGLGRWKEFEVLTFV